MLKINKPWPKRHEFKGNSACFGHHGPQTMRVPLICRIWCSAGYLRMLSSRLHQNRRLSSLFFDPYRDETRLQGKNRKSAHQRWVWDWKIDSLSLCTHWPFSWHSALILKKCIKSQGDSPLDQNNSWKLQLAEVTICCGLSNYIGYNVGNPCWVISGHQIWKSHEQYVNFYCTRQHVKFHDDVMSGYGDIGMKVSRQSFWFHYRLWERL